MYIEYCSYDKYIEDYSKEIQNVFTAIGYDVDGLCLPIHLIREVKEYIPPDLIISAPIDYPIGYSCSKTRYSMVLHALKSGANAIDYVPNQYFLRSKFTELTKEIKCILNMCEDYKASFRLFLDYHNYGNVITIAKAYKELGIDLMFPTVGYHHDDFFDNIITSKIIQDKTDISMIFNGYTWMESQIDLIKETDIFGLRLYNLQLLV